MNGDLIFVFLKFKSTNMKKLLFFAFTLSLFLLQGCKQAKPVTLNVTVGDKICQTSQWVYWFSLDGNEYNILDSCYLKKGQHSFTMKKVIPDMYGNYWLTFTKHGQLKEILYLNKGQNVKLTLKKGKLPEIEGSPESLEFYGVIRKARKVKRKIDSLTDVLGTIIDSLTRIQIANNIKNLRDYMDFKLALEDFKDFKTPRIYLMFMGYAEARFPRNIADSLVTVMKQRFPDNKRVQEYPHEPKYPLATLHSKWVYRRYRQILTERTGHSFKRPATPKLSAEQKKAISQIKPLKLGDKVPSLAFKGINGKRIALKDIHTPYVLIDFWASWCTPCRVGVPDLKLVQAKYKGRLTIYAVSLDKNKSNWRKAIRIDKSSMLTQVIEDSSEFTQKRIQKLFGIKFIPRNFLLDQHRKIIAINIPGDSLEQKFEKLFGK